MQGTTTDTTCETRPGNGKAGLETKLAHDQLRLALRNLRPNFWIMPAFAAVVAVMFAHWIPLSVLVTWFAIVVAGVLPEAILAALFMRKDPPPPEARKWLWFFAGSYALATSGFASMAHFFGCRTTSSTT